MNPALVSHPVFGEGELLDVRARGTELLVRFKSGLRLWVAAERVRREVSDIQGRDGSAQLLSADSRPLDLVQARRMVEAFRLGIVPHQDVEDFTFGREEETKQITDALERLKGGQGDALLVEGDYGAGKTHLLELFHHLALRTGLAVSRVEFDPQDVSPNRPKRVYRELVHNLRWVETESRDTLAERGFRDLLRKALKLPMADHVFLGPVLDRLGKLRDSDSRGEVFWQMIEGESTKEYATRPGSPYRIRGGQTIPALYDFSTAGDFYCYILSGLSHICHELKLGGLVLLIDEAETVTHLWDILAFARGINFIEGLIRTALNDPELKRINSRLIHNRVRTTPYIYKEPHILLVIATTPEPYDYTYLKMTNYARRRLALRPLRDRALLDAFDQLVTIYRQAYPGFEPEEVEKQRLLDFALGRKGEGIRHLVKLCVEALDVMRLNKRAADYRRA